MSGQARACLAEAKRYIRKLGRGPEASGLRPYLLIFAFALAASAAQADTAVLRNGHRLRITAYQAEGERVRLDVPGGTLYIAAADLLRVEHDALFISPARRALDVPFGELIMSAATRHGLDPHLVASVIAAESKFNPRAISRRNARGLMQLIPETAAELGVTDIFDPRQNIEAGTRYLAALLVRFAGDVRLALAAYNAGPTPVERLRNVPPYAETRSFVARVLDTWHRRRNPNTGADQSGG